MDRQVGIGILKNRDGPLCALQADMTANGTGMIQWNIPLYSDDVFWLVRGSQRRCNMDAENRQLLEHPRVRMKLRAGDGAVYPNAVMHWGSDYRTKLRRPTHFAYRVFGSDLFSYRSYINWTIDLAQHLSSSLREMFYGFAMRFAAEFDVIALVFRAVVDEDEVGFREGLAALHPGEKARMVRDVLNQVGV